MDSRLDVKLGTVTFKTGPEPHIVVHGEVCRTCESRPCTIACPARLFVWEGEQISFNCEGCLECGACRVVCPHDALQWSYPLGGYGVRFRWG